MAEYIERDAAIESFRKNLDGGYVLTNDAQTTHILQSIHAADVRPVVTCADCKHNNACLTQAFVEDESKVPFDRNIFFCADGKRADDA